MPKVHWHVDPEDEGQRLDKFLAEPDRLGSRQRASTSLERGRVYVNDAEVSIAQAGTRLSAGDVVSFWADRPGSGRRSQPPQERSGLDIIYEDAVLIVVNKPAGLLTVPLERKGSVPSVFDVIADSSGKHRRQRPFVVHRIDQDSSGLVVFAKNASTQRALQDQFRRREPERVYYAIVHGRVEPAGAIRFALRLTFGDTTWWVKAATPTRPKLRTPGPCDSTVKRFTPSACRSVTRSVDERSNSKPRYRPT